MSYPTREEFVTLLSERSHIEIVEEHLIKGVPFAFRDNAALYERLLQTLSHDLELGANSITLVGSGRIGFSLSPHTFGTPFSVESDLDILIVSEDLFDAAWFDMVRLGRKYFSLETKVRNWVTAHRTNNVFWGFIEPGRLPGVVHFAGNWFRTFHGLSRHQELARRDVSGRLYRTWDHVRIHQLHTLRKIQQMHASQRKESQ
jgi:hypothetical protein